MGHLVGEFGKQLDDVSKLASEFKNLSTLAKKRKLDSYPVHFYLNRYIDLVNMLNEQAFKVRSVLDDELCRGFVKLDKRIRKHQKMKNALV